MDSLAAPLLARPLMGSPNGRPLELSDGRCPLTGWNGGLPSPIAPSLSTDLSSLSNLKPEDVSMHYGRSTMRMVRNSRRRLCGQPEQITPPSAEKVGR